MAMCAGAQKLSRPIERCQETSHDPPMLAEVTASAPAQMYQGTEALCAFRWATASEVTKTGGWWAAVDIRLSNLTARDLDYDMPDSNQSGKWNGIRVKWHFLHYIDVLLTLAGSRI